jgi:Fe-S-cluster containining protein
MNPAAFPCTQCGACCRNVDKAAETRMLDRGDGCCVHYDDASRLCKIYESRPDICRVDVQFQRHYSHMGWKAFCEVNVAACNTLQNLQSVSLTIGS